MKKISVALFLIIVLCLNGCLPSENNITKNVLPDENNGTVLFRIEYKSGRYVTEQIIQVLRSARAADIDLNRAGILDDRVEARFRTLTKDKEQNLKQQIEQVDGVIHVEIVKDGMPTRNPFF